jgi:adenylate cyclase
MSTVDKPSRFLKVTFVRSDGFTQILTVGPGESILVGRDLVCDCRLEGRKVSRRHMRLSYRPEGRIIVQDNTSHNGTFVNGVRIVETVVEGSEVIQVGEWEGRVEFVDSGAVRRRTLPGVMPAVALNEPDDSPLGPPPPEQSGPLEYSSPFARAQAPIPLSALVDVGNDRTGFDGVTDPELKGMDPVSRPAPPGHAALPPPPGAEGVVDNETRVVDMRTVWKWDDSAPSSEVSQDAIRAIPVVENPIVQRLSQTSQKLDFRGIRDLGTSNALATPGHAFNIDAVALQLVFQVTQSLQSATSMDAFLAEMSDSLINAARAKAVVILLPDDSTGELVPRVIKNRRADESVHLSRTVIEHAIKSRVALATEDAAADERFASGESVLRFDLKAVLVAPLTRGEEVIGAIYLTRDLPFSNTERDLVAALAHLIAMGLERSRLREQIEREEQQRRTLERFHAPDVVKRLMMQDTQSRGHGLFLETLEATVLFCDMSGFTKYCESHDAEAVGRLLNLYLGNMTEVVFAHGGTVDKYIGDAIMCIFGAPFQSPDDALRAVQCAMAMRRGFHDLFTKGDLGNEEMQVHIGINTGPVVAGTVGSSRRMEYTALGDTVNIAARLEGVAKPGQIVIGPSTAALVKDHIPLRELGQVALKGRDVPVHVFEVPDEMATGMLPKPSTDEQSPEDMTTPYSPFQSGTLEEA